MVAHQRVMSLAEFQSWLVDWVRSGASRILGASHQDVVARVSIGDEVCALHGGTTRDGVVAFLDRLDETRPFYIVPSTRGRIHRVSVGDASARIPGFYLYTEHTRDESEPLATGSGVRFSLRDVGFAVLEAVAFLHLRGHQRLRVYPNHGDLGPWRVAVGTVIEGGVGHHYDLREPCFRYSEGTRFRVEGQLVTPETSVEEIAVRILDRAAEPTLGRDWEYAGWYSELLARSRRVDLLPTAYCPFSDFPYEEGWEIGAKSGIAFPPPPVRGQRSGFRGLAFDEPQMITTSTAADVPFTSPSPPSAVIVGDITRWGGFQKLLAAMDDHFGCVGLYATTSDGVFERDPHVGWRRSSPWSRTSVEVTADFVKSFDVLRNQGAYPTLELVMQMRTFPPPSHA